MLDSPLQFMCFKKRKIKKHEAQYPEQLRSTKKFLPAWENKNISSLVLR